MVLLVLLERLEHLAKKYASSYAEDAGNEFYSSLHQMVSDLVSMDDHVSLKTRLQALTSCIAVYSKMRCKDGEKTIASAQSVLKYLCLECCKILLRVDFDTSSVESDFTLSLFRNVIIESCPSDTDENDHRWFKILENLLLNDVWNNPLLLAIMNGSEIEEDHVKEFIDEIEHPELVLLRIDFLFSRNLDDHAVNLIDWLTKMKKFDVQLHSLLLLLLYDAQKFDEFHRLCSEMSCCMACHILRHVHEETIDKHRMAILTMSQTFLVLDWVKTTDLKCTKVLLRYWLTLERHYHGENKKEFIVSINKILALSKSNEQLVSFLDVMQSLFGMSYLNTCSNLALQALHSERHNLECTRLYLKDKVEHRKASKLLSDICDILARLFHNHQQMRLTCYLSSACLSPSNEHYFALDDFYETERNISLEPLIVPSDVDKEGFQSLWEAVKLLQPRRFHLAIDWEQMKPMLRTHFNRCGWRYDQTIKAFKNNNNRKGIGCVNVVRSLTLNDDNYFKTKEIVTVMKKEKRPDVKRKKKSTNFCNDKRTWFGNAQKKKKTVHMSTDSLPNKLKKVAKKPSFLGIYDEMFKSHEWKLRKGKKLKNQCKGKMSNNNYRSWKDIKTLELNLNLRKIKKKLVKNKFEFDKKMNRDWMENERSACKKELKIVLSDILNDREVITGSTDVKVITLNGLVKQVNHGIEYHFASPIDESSDSEMTVLLDDSDCLQSVSLDRIQKQQKKKKTTVDDDVDKNLDFDINLSEENTLDYEDYVISNEIEINKRKNLDVDNINPDAMKDENDLKVKTFEIDFQIPNDKTTAFVQNDCPSSRKSNVWESINDWISKIVPQKSVKPRDKSVKPYDSLIDLKRENKNVTTTIARMSSLQNVVFYRELSLDVPTVECTLITEQQPPLLSPWQSLSPQSQLLPPSLSPPLLADTKLEEPSVIVSHLPLSRAVSESPLMLLSVPASDQPPTRPPSPTPLHSVSESVPMSGVNEFSLAPEEETFDAGGFKCSFCPKIIKSYWGHKLHISRMHGVISGDKELRRTRGFKCSICSKIISSVQGRRIHKARLHGIYSGIKNKSVPFHEAAETLDDNDVFIVTDIDSQSEAINRENCKTAITETVYPFPLPDSSLQSKVCRTSVDSTENTKPAKPCLQIEIDVENLKATKMLEIDAGNSEAANAFKNATETTDFDPNCRSNATIRKCKKKCNAIHFSKNYVDRHCNEANLPKKLLKPKLTREKLSVKRTLIKSVKFERPNSNSFGCREEILVKKFESELMSVETSQLPGMTPRSCDHNSELEKFNSKIESSDALDHHPLRECHVLLERLSLSKLELSGLNLRPCHVILGRLVNKPAQISNGISRIDGDRNESSYLLALQDDTGFIEIDSNQKSRSNKKSDAVKQKRSISLFRDFSDLNDFSVTMKTLQEKRQTSNNIKQFESLSISKATLSNIDCRSSCVTFDSRPTSCSPYSIISDDDLNRSFHLINDSTETTDIETIGSSKDLMNRKDKLFCPVQSSFWNFSKNVPKVTFLKHNKMITDDDDCQSLVTDITNDRLYQFPKRNIEGNKNGEIKTLARVDFVNHESHKLKLPTSSKLTKKSFCCERKSVICESREMKTSLSQNNNYDDKSPTKFSEDSNLLKRGDTLLSNNLGLMKKSLLSGAAKMNKHQLSAKRKLFVIKRLEKKKVESCRRATKGTLLFGSFDENSKKINKNKKMKWVKNKICSEDSCKLKFPTRKRAISSDDAINRNSMIKNLSKSNHVSNGLGLTDKSKLPVNLERIERIAVPVVQFHRSRFDLEELIENRRENDDIRMHHKSCNDEISVVASSFDDTYSNSVVCIISSDDDDDEEDEEVEVIDLDASSPLNKRNFDHPEFETCSLISFNESENGQLAVAKDKRQMLCNCNLVNTSSSSVVHRCIFCRKSFKSEKLLRRHQSIKHNSSNDETSILNNKICREQLSMITSRNSTTGHELKSRYNSDYSESDGFASCVSMTTPETKRRWKLPVDCNINTSSIDSYKEKNRKFILKPHTTHKQKPRPVYPPPKMNGMKSLLETKRSQRNTVEYKNCLGHSADNVDLLSKALLYNQMMNAVI